MRKEIDKLVAEAVLEDNTIEYEKYLWYISQDTTHIDCSADITSINKMYVLYGFSKEKQEQLENEFR